MQLLLQAQSRCKKIRSTYASATPARTQESKFSTCAMDKMKSRPIRFTSDESVVVGLSCEPIEWHPVNDCRSLSTQYLTCNLQASCQDSLMHFLTWLHRALGSYSLSVLCRAHQPDYGQMRAANAADTLARGERSLRPFAPTVVT